MMLLIRETFTHLNSKLTHCNHMLINIRSTIVLIMVMIAGLSGKSQDGETYWKLNTIYREDKTPFRGATVDAMQEMLDYNFHLSEEEIACRLNYLLNSVWTFQGLKVFLSSRSGTRNITKCTVNLLTGMFLK